MSTSVRIGKDTKRKIVQLADLEGISQLEVINRAIAFYQLALMRRFLESGNFEFTPEMVEAFSKARQWLQRMGKRKFRELIKVKKA